MDSPDLCCQWAEDLPPPIKEHIQSAIQIDNERYVVVPCHPGQMTATVRLVKGAGEEYLYQLRCARNVVIRRDGGMLPVTGAEPAT